MNTKPLRRLIAVLPVMTPLVVLGALGYPEGKLTLRVIDEEGQPVAGATAGITFELPGGSFLPMKKIPFRGVTDAEGKFSASASATADVVFGASKEGFYTTYGDPYRFKSRELGRWEPWDPTIELVLKRIVNPVPMYARRVVIELPVENTPAGFDLMEADWVAPHGRGKCADFVFLLRRQIKNQNDYWVNVTLSFSNPDDGIQRVERSAGGRSDLRLPRLAPENGYLNQWSIEHGCIPGKGFFSEPSANWDFVFRVRSIATDGSLNKALYGKIRGELEMGGYLAKRVGLIFTYYLNPDGTRNLEFDPKRNLFKSLKPFDQVQQP